MIPIVTKEAIFCGFTLTPDQFKNIVDSLCSDLVEPDDCLKAYVGMYDGWRRKIPTPERSKVPRLRMIYKPGVNLSLSGEDTIDRFIFPTRWVEYESDAQLQDQALLEPNDQDLIRLQDFAAFTEGVYGVKLPPASSFGFGCIKDYHPTQEWRDW
ncbi:hypothetical protein QCA50_013030 [Cerrena zonata]|uniref:Uncharacterized protein n=1 Tax=Cerrena zonata TaxID=2478898 RepID=A0AAW0FW80_9APHY